MLKKASITTSMVRISDVDELEVYGDKKVKPAIYECFRYFSKNTPNCPEEFVAFLASLFYRIASCIDSEYKDWPFIKELFDIDKVIKDDSYTTLVIDILEAMILDSEGYIDIMPIIRELINASQLLDSNHIKYFRWQLALKRMITRFTEQLYEPLKIYYKNELDILEDIILKDVTVGARKHEHSAKMLIDMSEVIYDYASKRIHIPDMRFNRVHTTLIRMGNFNKAIEFRKKEKEYIFRMEEKLKINDSGNAR